jgi:hypothetical protein
LGADDVREWDTAVLYLYVERLSGGVERVLRRREYQRWGRTRQNPRSASL